MSRVDWVMGRDDWVVEGALGWDAVPVFFGKSEGEGHDDGMGVGDRFEL